MFKKAVMMGGATLLACGSAFALEGVSAYPNGASNFMTGAIPPPGVYGVVYGKGYSADGVKDASGNDTPLPPDFNIRAYATSLDLVWVPGVKVLGGDLAAHAVVPLLSVKTKAGGVSQSKTGVGDSIVGVGTGYHHSPNLHTFLSLNAYLPTGGYTLGDMVNLGANHSAFETAYTVTYIDPNGFNADIAMGLIFNQKNTATNYQDGNVFHFDYALGWGLGGGWTAGAGGFYTKQLTNDKIAGVSTAGTKSSGMSIGPVVKYDSPTGWSASVKWEKELNVKNGAEGSALWMKYVFTF